MVFDVVIDFFIEVWLVVLSVSPWNEFVGGLSYGGIEMGCRCVD